MIAKGLKLLASVLSCHDPTARQRVTGFRTMAFAVAFALVISIHSASCQSDKQTLQDGTTIRNLQRVETGDSNINRTVAVTVVMTPESVTATPSGPTPNSEPTVQNVVVFNVSSNGSKSNSSDTGTDQTENGTQVLDQGADDGRADIERKHQSLSVATILTPTEDVFSQEVEEDKPSVTEDFEQIVKEDLKMDQVDIKEMTAIDNAIQKAYQKFNSTSEDLDTFIEDEIHVPDCLTGFLPFEQGEWKIIDPNRTLQLLLSGLLVDEEHYVRFGNFVFICNDFLNFSQNFTVQFTNTSPKAHTPQEILTLSLSSLSVVGMLVFIAIALVKKRYKKIPDILKLNLTCSLVLAQTLFVFSDEIPLGGFCVFLAILTHYLYLAAFFTMNVLAFDLFLSLGGVSGAMGFRSIKAYMLYIWLTPCVIVIISIILEFSMEPKFLGYGTDICWIKQPIALVVTFVAPIGLVLTSNVYFFLHTVLNITVSSLRTAHARHGANYSQLLAFLKISTLIGLGWILGFVAAGTQQEVLWYIFIVVNSSQGFLISMSFMTSPEEKAAHNNKHGVRSPHPGGMPHNQPQRNRAAPTVSNTTDTSSVSMRSTEPTDLDDPQSTTINVTAVVELDNMSPCVPSQNKVKVNSSKMPLSDLEGQVNLAFEADKTTNESQITCL